MTTPPDRSGQPHGVRAPLLGFLFLIPLLVTGAAVAQDEQSGRNASGWDFSSWDVSPWDVPEWGESGWIDGNLPGWGDLPDDGLDPSLPTGPFFPDRNSPAADRVVVPVEGTGELVALDVPAGSSVVIEVKRLAGARPAVVGVIDGDGRSVAFKVRKSRLNRVRLERIPGGEVDGLEIHVAGMHGEPALLEVSARVRADRHDESREWVHPWVPRELVMTGSVEVDPLPLLPGLGLPVLSASGPVIVIRTGPLRAGFELEDARWLQEQLSRGSLTGKPMVEPNVLAQVPEGSQKNVVVLGSEFGRQYRVQSSLRAIRAHRMDGVADGSGVVVAVLDTGIDATHSALAASVLPGFDLVDFDDDPSEVADGVDRDGDGTADEGYGHGTFVAGVVLAVAPAAQILPVRVLDSEGRGTAASIAQGIYYAVGRGAHVLNLSLGSEAYSTVLAQAVQHAVDSGVVVVAAAGNRGKRGDVDFPGAMPGVLNVSALGRNGKRARFSNGNRTTGILAPGRKIIGPHPGERWGQASGTSFSAALVSGAAALYVQHRPELTASMARRVLTVRGRLNLRRLAR